MILNTQGTIEFFEKLRQVPLRGFNGLKPYLNAEISLTKVSPESLTPCQNYLLKPILASQAVLWAQLKTNHSVDILNLTEDYTVEFNGEVIPVLPPIVEESFESCGRTMLIINDGMHRISYARATNQRINVIIIRNVEFGYPYYAFPNENGWKDVKLLDELPVGFIKKTYRFPDKYRDYFRDFNAIFPGVQKERPLPTN